MIHKEEKFKRKISEKLFPLAEVVVNIEEMADNITNDSYLVENLQGLFLLLYLFFDKPLEHLERCVIFFLDSEINDSVDHPGYFLLMGIHIFEYLSRRCPFCLRCLESTKGNFTPASNDILKDLHGV